jgi:hypothetical protein
VLARVRALVAAPVARLRGSPAALANAPASRAPILTIASLFQQSGYRTFTAFATHHVQQHLHSECPHLLSSSRFVDLLPTVLAPLSVSLHTPLGTCTGISFSDATALAVCKPPRSGQHRVVALDAARGKTAVGWFYGCKLHRVVNDRGELLACCLTPGNADDRRPVPHLVKRLFGNLFGDRGYLSQDLAEELLVTHGVQLITKLRKNLRNRLLALSDKLLLRKRAIIESMVDALKNVCQSEPSRHRRPLAFLVNLLTGLLASCHLPTKPSLQRGLPALLAAS